MGPETPTNCFGGSETNIRNQAPTESTSSDLTKRNPAANNNSNDIPDLPKIQSSSPTKRPLSDNSPSKTRNRRRNEARRRSINHNYKKPSTNDGDQNQQKFTAPSSPQPLVAQNEPQSQPTPSESNTQVQTSDIATQNSDQNESITKGSEATRTDGRRDKTKEDKERIKELKVLKEQNKSQDAQIQNLVIQSKQQANKIKELETALLSTTRTCNQLDKLLQQELTSRTSLEAEISSLNQAITRLKSQVIVHEKNKSNNDELVRVLNATLMERETEVSILKLKLTRIQTNPSSTLALDSTSNMSLVKNDPCHAYTSAGRSNSEFDRNSYIRSSMIAEAASVRASTSQLRGSDKDASVWATVPEELTPSRRPQMIERNYDLTFGNQHYNNPYDIMQSLNGNNTSTPLSRDRRYKTLPRSMKSTSRDNFQKVTDNGNGNQLESSNNNPTHCQVTNLDDSNSTSHSSGNKTNTSNCNTETKQQLSNTTNNPTVDKITSNEIASFQPPSSTGNAMKEPLNQVESSHYSTLSKTKINSNDDLNKKNSTSTPASPPNLPARTAIPSNKASSGLKRIIDRFRRSDSSSNSQSKTELNESPRTAPNSPFKRGGNRSTHVGTPSDIRAQMTPIRQVMTFQTDKPFAEWDTDMLVDWLTMIGLSMYTAQCRRWVKCGAHIMNATPAEVDKGLGITNHLHRKKLRLAISELNGDCDKVTKAAARLDYLWVARWMDDIGLPQYKEAFINARVDGRVLNYLTVEDLVSMGVKSILHHASIRCGIRVLRSISFDLQLLKRRATTEEVEQMNSIRQKMSQTVDISDPLQKTNTVSNLTKETDVSLWTCHRVMEWLRLIDFAEFAPNLRGSGVHGGLLVFEDGFNIDTMCSILSIPISRTLLRRHLSSYFKALIGQELTQSKRHFQDLSSNQQLNPSAEIKLPKKSQLWFSKLKSSKVGQDGMDEYLCPMYPVEPQILKNKSRKNESAHRIETHQLSNIPESVNV